MFFLFFSQISKFIETSISNSNLHWTSIIVTLNTETLQGLTGNLSLGPTTIQASALPLEVPDPYISLLSNFVSNFFELKPLHLNRCTGKSLLRITSLPKLTGNNQIMHHTADWTKDLTNYRQIFYQPSRLHNYSLSTVIKFQMTNKTH